MPKTPTIKESKPMDTISLDGSAAIGGIEIDDEITLTVEARLIEESSRDYEGKPEKRQRYQILNISKSNSNNNAAAKMQSRGKGLKE